MDNTQIATLTLAHNIVASAPVTATAPHVPTIDIAPFLTGAPDGRRHVAAAIRDACEGTGFFYLTGHGVPPVAIEAIFAASRSSSLSRWMTA